MKKTNRECKDVETGILFSIYQDTGTHENKLIYDGEDESVVSKGTEVNGWYFSVMPIMLKLNTKKEIELDGKSFYNLKEGEKVTHIKYTGLDKKYRRF